MVELGVSPSISKYVLRNHDYLLEYGRYYCKLLTCYRSPLIAHVLASLLYNCSYIVDHHKINARN